MRTVYVIRHGETDWNREGRLQGHEHIPLNQTGREQAEVIGRLFIGAGISRIVSSPLSRAYHTALIIGRIIGVARIDVHDLLIERDYGTASGLLPAERGSAGAPARQESRPELRARVMEAFKDITERFSDAAMMIVSHGAVINSLISYLTDGQQGTGKTRLVNGSISKLVHTGRQWSPEYINRAPADMASQHQGGGP